MLGAIRLQERPRVSKAGDGGVRWRVEKLASPACGYSITTVGSAVATKP
jgi:hypothetical protein